MLQLIKNAQVYSPEPSGQQDVLIGGEQILAMESTLSLQTSGLDYAEVDANGALLVPGFIDPLAHITGGGGEGGCHTRTPEMQLTDATTAGVTTLLAALGTDATTRTLPDLLAKAGGLSAEGLTVYCYTGSYEVPVRTLTGQVRDDIILVDKMIGVAELAIADHRSSVPDARALAQVAAAARVGGMLAGKAGVVMLHVGSGASRLDIVEEALALSDVPARQFWPTHANRSPELLQQAVKLSQQGMCLDLTTSETPMLMNAAESLAEALGLGVNPERVTMSSDGHASLPVFNDRRELVGLKMGQVSAIHRALQQAVLEHQVSLPQALQAVSTNAAQLCRLPGKGRLAVGQDADLVMLDPTTLAIDSVWARGQQMVRDGAAVVTGTFG